MLVYRVKLRGKIERYSECTLHSYERLGGLYWKLYWMGVGKWNREAFNRFGNYRIKSSDIFDTLNERADSIYTYIVNLDHVDGTQVIWSNLMGFKELMADVIRDNTIDKILE